MLKTQTRKENLKTVYKLHLVNNNLEDDSDGLTSQDIEEYVFLHIDKEDREFYGCVSA